MVEAHLADVARSGVPDGDPDARVRTVDREDVGRFAGESPAPAGLAGLRVESDDEVVRRRDDYGAGRHEAHGADLGGAGTVGGASARDPARGDRPAPHPVATRRAAGEVLHRREQPGHRTLRTDHGGRAGVVFDADIATIGVGERTIDRSVHGAIDGAIDTGPIGQRSAVSDVEVRTRSASGRHERDSNDQSGEKAHRPPTLANGGRQATGPLRRPRREVRRGLIAGRL